MTRRLVIALAIAAMALADHQAMATDITDSWSSGSINRINAILVAGFRPDVGHADKLTSTAGSVAGCDVATDVTGGVHQLTFWNTGATEMHIGLNGTIPTTTTYDVLLCASRPPLVSSFVTAITTIRAHSTTTGAVEINY